MKPVIKIDLQTLREKLTLELPDKKIRIQVALKLSNREKEIIKSGGKLPAIRAKLAHN